MTMKNKRIEKLRNCIIMLKELQAEYYAIGSGWTLLQSARSNVVVLHHLESEATFDAEILGVKDDQ